MTVSPVLLEARGLTKHFVQRSDFRGRGLRRIRAVDAVSLTIRAGETLGVVGESGCGKTTLGRLLLRLVEATAGEIFFNGVDLRSLSRREMRAYRRQLQIIFQDSYGSLNPRSTVGGILGEALRIHNLASGNELHRQVAELLDRVGLPSSSARLYPHEFSGGQRQRIGIARALAVNPSFVVADEPVSALDVSIQAQIINLLHDLQADLGLTYLFIAHDLSVVRHLSDRIAVMYLGRIVEMADRDRLFKAPRHPYTRALLASIPLAVSGGRKRVSLVGDVADPGNVPSGCPFHPRCPERIDVCERVVPGLEPVGDGHRVACLLYQRHDASDDIYANVTLGRMRGTQ